jgi:hypothetical protein
VVGEYVGMVKGLKGCSRDLHDLGRITYPPKPDRRSQEEEDDPDDQTRLFFPLDARQQVFADGTNGVDGGV